MSILGHPLSMLSVFTLLISFQLYDAIKAFILSFIVIGVVVIPVAIRNYIKVKNKEYTNFDVSDQKQRQSFYPFAIILLSIAAIVLYFIPDTTAFFIGTSCALLMVGCSAIINFKIKTSLHTSVSIFLAVTYLNLSLLTFLLLLSFSVLIAASRVVLRRHTLVEIITGACIGVAFAIINNYVLSVAI